MTGFEPVNGGVKVRCLAAWLHPNIGMEKADCIVESSLGYG